MRKFFPTIGLEIHTELKTKTKMFCSCENDPFETRPNFNICPICTGHPGTLPTINEEAVKKVIKTGLALNCQISECSFFERKNYFYPDLPKGYQISQYQTPFCQNGFLEINGKKIKIKRVHLEEDTARLIHEKNFSLVDFNRAGVPLMELVTEPNIHSAKEAKSFAEELQLILRWLDVSGADMEKGQMRIEANISLSNEPPITANESRIILKEESYKLMGLLFEVHNKLGPIYKEKNYQDAVEEVLKREKIPYQKEKVIKVDFVINNKILLEIKAKPFIKEEDIRQTSRYIKSLNLSLGIIANFKQQKLEFKRVINPSFEKKSSLFEENLRKLGTKVEIKNLNSFRTAEEAINYEIERQSKILEKGGKIIQETLGWDDIKKRTFSQREKEEAKDYRYFPEPDLPPLTISKEEVLKIRAEIPELPQEKRKRLKREYDLNDKSIGVFIRQEKLGQYFEKVISELPSRLEKKQLLAMIKLSENYILSDLLGLLKEHNILTENLKILPEDFAEFITLIYEGKISSKIAKKLLEEMLKSGKDPSNIIQEKGLSLISKEEDLENLAKEIIAENEKAVADFKAGKPQALQFLIGKMMQKTKGRADPQKAKEILIKFLK